MVWVGRAGVGHFGSRGCTDACDKVDGMDHGMWENGRDAFEGGHVVAWGAGNHRARTERNDGRAGEERHVVRVPRGRVCGRRNGRGERGDASMESGETMGVWNGGEVGNGGRGRGERIGRGLCDGDVGE